MKKLFALLLILALLLTSCAMKQEETADFAVPTPAVEEAEPTPTPEPIPTEKPYSAYNEKLAGELMIVKPISCWAVEPNDTLYSLKASSDLVALVYVEGKKERIWRDEEIGAEDGCTEAEVRIEKIWTGDSAKEGDTIIVREDCYLSDRDNGVTALCTNEDYFPMREHAYYLLFLEDNFDNPGTFMMTCVHYSKFPVNPMVDDLMKAGKKMHYKDLELAQDGQMEYYELDPNLPMPDVKMLFDEVYEAYYNDDAILKVLEEEREYEKHYGGSKPVEWEPAPEEEGYLWVCDTISPKIIFVPPTAEDLGDGSLKEIHKQMNEKGFDASELLTLTPERDARLWISRYDFDAGTQEDERFGLLMEVSLFTKDGELLKKRSSAGDFWDMIHEKEHSEVVFSVTLRYDTYWEDEPRVITNHYFYIVDLEEMQNSGWYD